MKAQQDNPFRKSLSGRSVLDPEYLSSMRTDASPFSSKKQASWRRKSTIASLDQIDTAAYSGEYLCYSSRRRNQTSDEMRQSSGKANRTPGGKATTRIRPTRHNDDETDKPAIRYSVRPITMATRPRRSVTGDPTSECISFRAKRPLGSWSCSRRKRCAVLLFRPSSGRVNLH